MDRFVARQNIKHFKEMLDMETDARKRQVLQAFLEEEIAKLEALGFSDMAEKVSETLVTAPYRFHRLNSDGRSTGVIDVDAVDDGHAQELAIIHHFEYDIEIWHGERLVGSVAGTPRGG